MNVFLGADPEVFMANEQGLIRNAHNVIPGTKEKPHPVKHGAIQVDGMALEFNVNPTTSRTTWLANIDAVLKALQDALPLGYRYVVKPSHRFPQEYMKQQPAESLELGCDPDFNAYTKAPNTTPDAATNLRTAAGHIHFGWTKNETMDDWFFHLCCDFVKHLDCSLGVYSWLIHDDSERKQLYGRAGAFRPKPYGVEYRVPNNMWLSDKRHINNVWKIAVDSFHIYQDGIKFHERPFCRDTPELINNWLTSKSRINSLRQMKSRWIEGRFDVSVL